MPQTPEYKTIDKFDKMFGELVGIPDCAKSKPSTVTTETIIGTQTFIVQTIRQREVGDWVFVQYLDSQGSVRLVIPPAAAETIARQRDALTTKNRKRAARDEAQRRKAAGIQPGFMKGKKKAVKP